MSNSEEELYLSVARINANSRGVAFLVEKFNTPRNGVYGLWLSCTHVIGENTIIEAFVSDSGIYPVFSFQIQLEVSQQFPVNREDLTLLYSTSPLPDHIIPLMTKNEWDSTNHAVSLYGFPDDCSINGTRENNILIGSVRNTDSNNNPQIVFKSAEITGGFSGSPVFDTKISAVIGLAVEVANTDANGRRRNTSYAIPVSFIGKCFPELELYPNLPESTERISYASLKVLKNVHELKKLDSSQLTLKELLEKDIFLRKLKHSMFSSIDAELHDHLPTILFYNIISGKSLSREEQKDIAFLVRDIETPWYHKCLVVSALTVSLIAKFDEIRLNHLIDFLNEEEEKVWQRALTGIVFGLFQKEELVKANHKNLYDKLLKIKSNNTFQLGIKYLTYSLNRMKFKEYQEKLEEYRRQLTTVDIELPQKNIPYFANDFIKEVAKEDSSFALYLIFDEFKKSDKFKEPHFWFLPFYKDNPAVKELLSLKEQLVSADKMETLLLNSITIHDSQKYSLCYYYDKLSDKQIIRLEEIFSNEITALDKLSSTDEREAESIKHSIFSSILNDLYQFQLFFPKEELGSIIDFQMEMQRLPVNELICSKQTVLEFESEKYYLLGKSIEDTDPEGAILNFKTAAELNPGNYEPYFKLGNIFFKTKDYEQPLENYEKANNVNPSNEAAICNCGVVLERLDRFEEAISCYNKAIAINPEFGNAYKCLGIAYYNKQMWKEAIKAYRSAIKLPPVTYAMYSMLGDAYFKNGMIKKAEEQYKMAIKLNPMADTAYASLGEVYMSNGKLKKAVKQYEVAVGINPQNIFAKFQLGYHSLCIGDIQKAESVFSEVLEFDENDKDALVNLGHIYLIQNNLDYAKELYSKSKILFQDDPLFLKVVKDDYKKMNLAQNGLEETFYLNFIESL